MLKLENTLPNLANNCLHKSTSANFFPVTEVDKDFPKNVRQYMIGEPSKAFARKTVVVETLIRQSSNIYKKLSELKSTNFSRTLCVNPCRQDFSLDTISTKICKGSNINKTREETWKN